MVGETLVTLGFASAAGLRTRGPRSARTTFHGPLKKNTRCAAVCLFGINFSFLRFGKKDEVSPTWFLDTKAPSARTAPPGFEKEMKKLRNAGVETHEFGVSYLKEDMRGDEVKELQRFLQEESFFMHHGGPTGHFDRETRDAVKAWQRKHGVVQSGGWGYQSRAQYLTLKEPPEPLFGFDAGTSGVISNTKPWIQASTKKCTKAAVVAAPVNLPRPSTMSVACKGWAAFSAVALSACYARVLAWVEDDEAAAAAANDADTKWEREKVDAATSIDLAFEEAMRRIDASYKRCIDRL